MYSLYFDGASRGNPGDASYGAVLYNSKCEIVDECYGKLTGKSTNNQAEYAAILNGLKMAKRNNVTQLEIYGDSKLIIEQMCKRWKVKNEGLRLYYDVCEDLVREFENVSFIHVKRNLNTYADMLANKALDNGIK